MTTAGQPDASRASNHILSIASLVFATLGLLPVLPIVGSIAAIVTGIIARREIRARPDLYTGDGTARAGIILGWLGLAIWLIGGCLIILALVPYARVVGPGPVITVVPAFP
jgi:hypothetical protein